MLKNKNKPMAFFYYSLCLMMLSPAFIAAPSLAQNDQANWYLIDERIVGPQRDFSAQLLFANQTSLSDNGGFATLDISDINMRELKVDGKFNLSIIDSRMSVNIDCNKNIYKINSIIQYDQHSDVISNLEIDYILSQWITPDTVAFNTLMIFACDPRNNAYAQPFDGTIQPLNGLISYLNAGRG